MPNNRYPVGDDATEEAEVPVSLDAIPGMIGRYRGVDQDDGTGYIANITLAAIGANGVPIMPDAFNVDHENTTPRADGFLAKEVMANGKTALLYPGGDYGGLHINRDVIDIEHSEHKFKPMFHIGIYQPKDNLQMYYMYISGGHFCPLMSYNAAGHLNLELSMGGGNPKLYCDIAVDKPFAGIVGMDNTLQLSDTSGYMYLALNNVVEKDGTVQERIGDAGDGETPQGNRIWIMNSGDSYYWYESIFFDRFLTPAEMEVVYAYLLSEYGIERIVGAKVTDNNNQDTMVRGVYPRDDDGNGDPILYNGKERYVIPGVEIWEGFYTGDSEIKYNGVDAWEIYYDMWDDGGQYLVYSNTDTSGQSPPTTGWVLDPNWDGWFGGTPDIAISFVS